MSDPSHIGTNPNPRVGLTTSEERQTGDHCLSPNHTANGHIQAQQQPVQSKPLPQNGGKYSTLPRSYRRHTAQVTVDQVQEAVRNAASHKSILKSSPVKLCAGSPGRIDVIKEEVEIEVATNSRLRTTMHRSVEVRLPCLR